MTWDSQNRLVSCLVGGSTSTYKYGADGLRRQSIVNSITTYYVYDGQTMLREMKKNASNVLVPTATYLQGPRGSECRRDDTQAETDGQGHMFGKTRWYVYDGLGSVAGEVNVNGNLTSSPKYDMYGAGRANTGAASSKQGFVGNLGHMSDTETGLIYMRARYYDPAQGRFVSQDPSCSGRDWFSYCADNPVNCVDSTGKSSQSLLDALGSLGWWTAGSCCTLTAIWCMYAASWTKGVIAQATVATAGAGTAVLCFGMASAGMDALTGPGLAVLLCNFAAMGGALYAMCIAGAMVPDSYAGGAAKVAVMAAITDSLVGAGYSCSIEVDAQ